MKQEFLCYRSIKSNQINLILKCTLLHASLYVSPAGASSVLLSSGSIGCCCVATMLKCLLHASAALYLSPEERVKIW